MKYFKFKFLMVLLALAAAIPPAWAQQEVTVCDGTATTQYLPVYGYYFDWSQHNQMIYPASELADLPAGSFIYSVTFYPDNAISFSGAAVTFSMANMAEGTAAFPLNNYGSADGPIDVELTQVASVMPTSVNPWTITFDDPFEYTGGDLIIDVVTNEGTDSRIYFSGKDVGANYGYYSYGSYSKYLITTLPKATFAYEGEAKPYVGRVAPKSIDFGKLLPNEQKTENITLSNKGANAFTPILSGMEGTPFSTTYTPSAIAPGAEVTIPITYNPTAVGNHDATLSITANETSDIDLTVTLAGRCSNDITVEDGDVSQSYLPLFYPGYYTQKNQMIYPASDLTSLVGKQITGLTFYCNDALVFDGTYSVALGMTNQASYSDATPIEGLTTVATNHTATAGVAEFAIAFDEPFTYTGDNLVIQMEVTDKGTTGYAASPFYGTNQSSNTAYYWYNASYGDYGYTKAFLPKVTFDYVTGEAPVVTVDAPVFDPEDGTTFEENLTVSLTCATAGATIQYSYNGEYFIDYDAPIVIDETTTIYAKAVLGTVESETVSATYTKEAAPQPATNEFILLTDASKLEASKRIIFVNKENNKAMSSTQNNNNRSATDITINTSNVTTATEATEIFTLEKDGDYWLFKATKTPGYIYAAGANSSNQLKTEEAADTRAQATVTIAEDGKATVQFNAGTRNTLLYNNSNDIFSCYSGNQQPVYIFIENTGDTPEPPVQQVKAPTFNPEGGTYTEAQTVTIACETEGATIHYTVDGTEPTAESPVYNEAIAVGQTMTIKAIAMKEGMTDSEMASATYTINIPEPGDDCPAVLAFKDADDDSNTAFGSNKTSFLETVSDGAGFVGTIYSNNVYQGKTGLKFSSGSVNGHFAFDLADLSSGTWKTSKIIVRAKKWGNDEAQLIVNASDPVTLTDEFVDYVFPIAAGTVLNTVDINAVKRLYVKSITIMHECGDEPVQVTKPTFDPAAGEYTEAQTVTIACSTPGATIHYTVDGTEPTAESAVYSEPIAVGETMTIKAIAVKEGMTDSEIAEATYTINIPEPGEGKIYVKLTTPELTPGKKYIFVYEGSQAMAMGAFNSSSTKCSPVDVTINNNEVNIAGKDDIIEFTAGEGPAVYGSDTKQYTLALPNGQYLAYKSGTDFKLMDAVGNYDTEGLWRIKTHDTGYSVNNASATGRSIQKHTSTNMFGPYADGQDAVAIYVEKEEVTPEPEQVATPTFDPAEGTYTEAQTVTIACETEGATIHYTVDGTEPTAESPVYNEPIAVGETMTIKAIAVKEGMTDSEMASATYTINIPEPVVIGTPTFSPEAGSYTAGLTVNIACPTEGAVISYSTDGGETWTEGNTVTVNEDMTLMVKAEMAGGTTAYATAVYAFEFPVEPINIEPIEGYFQVKNLGNEKYAYVQGRKTLRFTDAPADKAGTVIRIKTDEHGKVLQLRSQAADLQHYADRAMSYVPELVHLVADKLELEGVGQLFGENGVDAILDKFNEGFDAHLYVEPAEGGYRIYGKTPSMQHVVDFYRENQAKCDAKLPMLEGAINRAIEKILEKTNGSGASILEEFSLRTIWEKMNNPYLTEPTDDESIMAFYHQVLMNKDFVWDFAYQTAMIYWTNLKNHPRYQNEIRPQLGEYADYIEKIEQIRPNFKYYIVQKDDKPDFISEGNVDIKGNAARTIWSVEPRTNFTVNIPEENKVNDKYVTTLYTDFAYDLPEGVEAYIVKGIIGEGMAVPVKFDGTTVPAQTPILLVATEAGDKELTLNTNDGSPVKGSILVGPDYLIREYQLKSETVVKLFDVVKGLFGEEIYNRYMQQYEYLQLRYSGMVNNRYFWGLSVEDVEKCTYLNEYGEGDCVVRSLDVQDGECAFYNNTTVSTNKAFIVNKDFDKVKLMFVGDVNRDGNVDVADVTAIIDILLIGPDNQYYANPTTQYPNGLDYEAADINGDGEISVLDTVDLIDFLLVEQGIDPYVEPED